MTTAPFSDIPIDRDETRPVHQQISDGIRSLIADAKLQAGMKLPSSRQLAELLDVNRSTVVQAYNRLMEDGVCSSGVGQGTFVADAPTPQRTERFNWSAALEGRTRPLLEEGLRELMPRPSPEIVHFGRAVPDPDSYPLEELREIIRKIVDDERPQLYDYAPPAGYEPLREIVKERVSRWGIAPDRFEVMIVNGSQQALHLLSSLLVREGSSAVVERPCFTGALDLFSSFGIPVTSVPMDAEGASTAQLSDILRTQRPSFIYTLPTFHNPTGLSMSENRRREFLDLVSRYQVPVLEDDWLGELRGEGDPPPLKAQDRGDHILTFSTVSKVLAPGFRIGWLLAPRDAFGPLCAAKARFDICTNLPGQRVVYEMMRSGALDRHIERVRALYARRREAALHAIREHFPEEIQATEPRGGLTLWIHLPRPLDAIQIFDRARSRGVIISPASLFSPDNAPLNGFRLCYSTTDEAQIESGTAILGEVLRESLSRSTSRGAQSPLV